MAPVAKSVVKGQRQKVIGGERRRSSRLSVQAGGNTPRTIIQNFLREGTCIGVVTLYQVVTFA